MTLPKNKQIIGFVAWLAVSFIAAGIGSAASIQASPFYTQLIRPDWAPPPNLFGPVWTILYALMGIAAWLVWRVGGFRAARTALTLFLAQLAINALWSCCSSGGTWADWLLRTSFCFGCLSLQRLLHSGASGHWGVRCSSRICFG